MILSRAAGSDSSACSTFAMAMVARHISQTREGSLGMIA